MRQAEGNRPRNSDIGAAVVDFYMYMVDEHKSNTTLEETSQKTVILHNLDGIRILPGVCSL